MNNGNGLHAGEIDWLASQILVDVRWLGVFTRDDLPDLMCESRP